MSTSQVLQGIDSGSHRMKGLEMECKELERKIERQLKHAKEVEEHIQQKEQEAMEKRRETEHRMQQLKEREVN